MMTLIRPLTFATLLALLALPGCAMRPKNVQGPSVDAIDAAMTIEYPGDRLGVLYRIAQRENLTPSEQIYVVNAICYGGYSSLQADALVALIRNPACRPETHSHIAKKLRTTYLGGEKDRVVHALYEEGDPGITE